MEAVAQEVAVAPVAVMEPTPVAVAVIEPEPVAVAAAVATEAVAAEVIEPAAPSGPGMEYPPTDPMEPDWPWPAGPSRGTLTATGTAMPD